MSVTVYHNPRCSSSRNTLTLLRDHAIEPDIIEYLKHPPDAHTLSTLLSQLGLTARELMRQKEAPYRDLNLADPALSEEALINAMVQHPILIQRPIVQCGDKAAIGRPPETVLEILP